MMTTRRPLGLPLTLLLTLALGAVFTPESRAQPPAEKLVEIPKTFTTKDGWTLPGTYYGNYDKETPVVIMIPGMSTKPDRLHYERPIVKPKDAPQPIGLAKLMQINGYAVVTVQLRKTGDAKHPEPRAMAGKVSRNDYAAMVALDLEAVKNFLLEEHEAGHLNVRKLGIIAAEENTLIATQFAVNDWNKRPYPDAPTLAARTPRGQDVQALVLFSPEDSIPFVPGGPLYKTFAAFDTATLLIVGSADRRNAAKAEKVQKYLKGGARTDTKIDLKTFPGKTSGTELLTPANTQLVATIYGFFEKNLKDLPAPWRSRKPNL